MDIVVYTDELQTLLGGFPRQLAFQLWNSAIEVTPYDTGNARANVFLTRATEKQIVVTWNTFNANYVDFLEQGVGPVKKHKGFISQKAIEEFMIDLFLWIVTGTIEGGSVQPPTVFTRQSKNVFSWEKNHLSNVGFSERKITQRRRKMVSKIRENRINLIGEQLGMKPANQNKNIGGLKPITKRVRGSRNVK